MKISKLAILPLIVSGINLSACDPSSISPEELAAAGSSSGTSSLAGVFEQTSDNLTEGNISSARISMETGEADGSGSFDSPITLWTGRIYNIDWDATATISTQISFDLFDVNDPDTSTSLGTMSCETDACNSESMRCWFNVANGTQNWFCADDIGDLIGGDSSLGDILSGLNLSESELPVTLGAKLMLCDESESNCDNTTIGYMELGDN